MCLQIKTEILLRQSTGVVCSGLDTTPLYMLGIWLNPAPTTLPPPCMRCRRIGLVLVPLAPPLDPINVACLQQGPARRRFVRPSAQLAPQPELRLCLAAPAEHVLPAPR
jgi:hypothetical protein